MSTNPQVQLSPNPQARPAFGTVLADQMNIATYKDGAWSAERIVPTAPITMHPAAHVIHYASTCFEGFKAYRWPDGSIRVFFDDMSEPIMIAEDKTFGAGYIGFGSFDDTGMVDNIVIRGAKVTTKKTDPFRK